MVSTKYTIALKPISTARARSEYKIIILCTFTVYSRSFRFKIIFTLDFYRLVSKYNLLRFVSICVLLDQREDVVEIC